MFHKETVTSTSVLSNLAKKERSPVQSGWKSGPVFGELLPISCIIGSPKRCMFKRIKVNGSTAAASVSLCDVKVCAILAFIFVIK